MDRDDFRKTLKEKKEALPSQEPAASKKDASKESPQEKRSVDEAELMATAFEALTTGDVNIEWDSVEIVKEGTDANSPTPPTPVTAQDAPVEVPCAPAPLRTKLDPGQWQGRAWEGQEFFSGQADTMSPAQPFVRLKANQLGAQQRKLLNKMSQLPESAVSTLSLRHLPRIEAMSHLRRHIAQMRLLGQRYLRIVTGKGIGSRGAPILRQEIVHWCILQAKQQALLWTPDLEMNGEYGAILVDLQGPGTST